MNWKKVKLESVCTIIAGQSPPSTTYNTHAIGLPFFQGKADFGVISPKVRIWCNSPQKIAEPNDILLSVRAPVGPTNICNEKSCIGRGLSAIRAKEHIYFKFILYFFKQLEPKLTLSGVGSTFGSISQTDIKNLEIPLPDLATQKHIAEILDKADALRQQNRQLLAHYDELLQSTFIELFGDPVKNPKGWKVKKLKEFGKVQTGNTPPRDNLEFYGDYIEWIKTDNINSNKIYVEQAKEFLSEKGLAIGRVIEANSLLVTCIAGSLKSIGNSALTNRKVTFNQQINSITPNKSVDALFLYILFKVNQKEIQNNTTQGMKRMITKSVFENVKMILPPLPLQQHFAKIVDQIEAQKVQVQSALAESEALFEGLLAGYFH